ncbi:hypothetical protein ACS0VN_02150 [Salmonella enterica subsp. enterica serovar Paratyphi A]
MPSFFWCFFSRLRFLLNGFFLCCFFVVLGVLGCFWQALRFSQALQSQPRMLRKRDPLQRQQPELILFHFDTLDLVFIQPHCGAGEMTISLLSKGFRE